MDQQHAWLRGPWNMSWPAAIQANLMRGDRGWVPLLATVGGYVVAGADLRACRPEAGFRRGRSPVVLDLAVPGAWFESVARTRLTLPAGNVWQLVNPAVGPGARHPSEERRARAS